MASITKTIDYDYLQIMDLLKIFKNGFIEDIKIIIPQRIFNEFSSVKYIEDIFECIENDDYCLLMLQHFDLEEFKKYINEDVDYDDESHFQTKEFHIAEKLYELKYYKSLFYLLDNNILSNINELDLFKNLFYENERDWICYFFDNFMNKDENLEKKIQFGYRIDFENANYDLFIFILNNYSDRIYFHPQFGLDCLKYSFIDNSYLQVFELHFKTDKISYENSFKYYREAIIHNNIEIMNYLFENGFEFKSNQLYDIAKDNPIILKWLYQHKLKPTRKQKTTYQLTQL